MPAAASGARPRLPRVAFDAGVPGVADPLPRMDVAGLVGYAARGPVHLPVPVDGVASFRAVFGSDVAVAATPGASPVTGLLGPAVEAYFRNGGRRCWVVRVAGDDVASTRLVLPGVVGLADPATPVRVAAVRARSPGSWGDALAVGTVLDVAAAGVPVAVDADARALVLEHGTAVEPGDVLRLRVGDGTASVLVRAATATATPAGTAVVWDRAVTVEPARDGLAPGPSTRTRVVTPDGPVPGPQVALELRDDELFVSGAGDLVDGGLLDVEHDGRRLLVGVGEEHEDHGRAVTAAVALSATDPASLGLVRVVERLRIAIAVAVGERLAARRDDLVVGPGSPRSWTTLTDDEEALASAAASEGPGPGPRFPIAADAPDPTLWWAPLLVPDDAPVPRPPVAPGHDGLDRHEAASFLDGELTDVGVRTLVDRADRIRHLSRDPRRLRGIHGLLGVDEVTVVAAPDAAHVGWVEEVVAPPAPPPAAPDLVAGPDGCTIVAGWTPVPGAASHEVEVAGDPAFDAGATSTRVDGTLAVLDVACACPTRRWVRVRARDDGGRAGPWSRGVGVLVPPAAFDDCVPLPEAPALSATATDDGRHRLAWSPAGPVDLDESTEPGFGVSRRRRATNGELVLDAPTDGHRWYRVRSVDDDGRARPWSTTVLLSAPVVARRRVRPAPTDGPATTLLDVQRALLRMCAARGDLVGVLATPSGRDRPGVLAHVGALTALDHRAPAGTVAPLDRDEEPALGHGILVHPWVAVGDGAGLAWHPPDGEVCGVIARRALADGAWRSVAGAPLRDVLATGVLRRGDAAALTAAGPVVVARNPDEVVLLTDDTLGTEAPTRSLGVRRLLALLRRVALRYGDTYVFEPNGPALHDQVRRTFEQLLSTLHQRGAFAGVTADEAFRVRTDAAVDPSASGEPGRFVVELRIAPTQPLTFIDVRLVRVGPGTVRLEVLA